MKEEEAACLLWSKFLSLVLLEVKFEFECDLARFKLFKGWDCDLARSFILVLELSLFLKITSFCLSLDKELDRWLLLLLFLVFFFLV